MRKMPKCIDALDKIRYNAEDESIVVGDTLEVPNGIYLPSFSALSAIQDEYIVYYTNTTFMSVTANSWLNIWQGVDANYPVFFEVLDNNYQSHLFALKYDPFNNEIMHWNNKGVRQAGYSGLFEEIEWVNNYYSHDNKFKFKWNMKNVPNGIHSILVRYVPYHYPTMPINIES